MLAVRSLRVASTSASARAFYSTGASEVSSLLEGLEVAEPLAGPPVGTVYASPNPPSPSSVQAQNPLEPKNLDPYLLKPRYSLYCQSTRNNTITTLMNDQFKPVAAFSGGSCGFKKVNRSTYEAGYQCAVRMFKTIGELRMTQEKNEKEKKTAKKGSAEFEIDLYFKGFGQGREALQRALMTSEGDLVRPLVVSVTDKTPIKIGGTRAKKARRL